MAKNLIYGELLEVYGKMLKEKQFEPMAMYYYDDYSLTEIGDKLGYSRQAALLAIQAGEAKLDEMEQKIGFWRYLQEQKKREQGN